MTAHDLAFPLHALGTTATGLTKRELFAAMAMQTKYAECETDPAKTAEWAVQVADALLAELAKEQP